MLRVLIYISLAAAALAATKPCPTAKRAPLINPNAYVLQAGDTVDVSDRGLEQSASPIGLDGKITVPLIGAVQAAGRTPAQLEADINARYRAGENHPATHVRVVSIGPRYFVDGKVACPGEFPKEGSVTVLAAIKSAGGLQKGAHRNEIHLLRDKKIIVTLKYKELTHPKSEQAIFVEDGDHVVVP